MKKFWILALCSMVLWACSKKMVPSNTVSPAASSASAIKPAEMARINMVLIEKGKKVFEKRCNQCHALKEPIIFEQQKWVQIMERMAPKAQLSDAQKTEVLAYVQHYAKDAPKDKRNM